LYINDNSWVLEQQIKDLHLRDILKVSIIGITESNGNFIQTPKGNVIVTKGSRLLVIGNQVGITKAKKLINKINKPKDLENV
jgi:voltage-gated potassium channel